MNKRVKYIYIEREREIEYFISCREKIDYVSKSIEMKEMKHIAPAVKENPKCRNVGRRYI